MVRIASTATALLIVSLLGMAGPASAAVINSAADNTNCTIAPATACTTVEIAPHPAWKNPADADVSPAVWISYAETGVDGDVLAPPSGTSVVMVIEEVLTNVIANSLTFTTWADDTARILINDVVVFAGTFTQGTCAIGPLGCEPDESLTLSSPLAGNVTITWEVFQVGTGTTPASNPFGLLYTGTYQQEVVEVPPDGVPEPFTLSLMGGGLIALGFYARRFRRRPHTGGKLVA